MLDRHSCVKVAHLAFTFTLATSILYVFTWPYAFLFPLLSLHIRFYDLPALPFREYVTLFFVVFASVTYAFGLSFIYPISSVLYIVLLGSTIFTIHLWDKHRPNQLYTALRALSVVLVSAITMVNPALLPRFTSGLVTSLLLAMILCFVIDKVVIYFYEGQDVRVSNDHHTEPYNKSSNEWQALFIFLPAVTVFIWLELFNYYVVLVAICVLTLNPNLKFIKNNSKQYLAANVLGGSIALGGYIIYSLAEPYTGVSWLLGITVTFLTAVLLGIIVYHSQFTSQAQFVLSPFALLLVQSDNIDINTLDNYQLRIVSVFIAVMYVYSAAQLASISKNKLSWMK